MKKRLQELWDSLTPKQRAIKFHYGNNSSIYMEWIALGPGIEDELLSIANRCCLLTAPEKTSMFQPAEIELESTKR